MKAPRTRKVKSTEATEEKESLLPVRPALLAHHRHRLEPLLEAWRTQNRVPPVLLLTGPSGIGKRAMATWLAQTFLCERAGFTQAPQADEHRSDPEADDGALSLFGEASPPAPELSPLHPVHDDGQGTPNPPLACGDCPACLRAMEGHWVDFQEIAAESEDGESGTLKIEQFRELKSTQGFGAFGNSYRITLIRDIDRITVQAANSLLKLLEEPPPSWIFLLTASDASLLLPTLVSRCQRLRLEPLPPSALAELLREREVPEARIAVLSELAQGSLGHAERLAQNELWERRALFFAWWSEPVAETNAWIEWAAAEPKNLELLLDLLESALTDSLKWLSSAQDPTLYAWRNADGAKALAQRAKKLTNGDLRGSAPRLQAFWLERAEAVFKTRTLSQAPLNRKLLIQELLLPFLQAGPSPLPSR